MKKLFLLIIFWGITAGVDAVEVSWMYIQHRSYESGRTYNRLAFGLADDNGRELSNDKDVASISLVNPLGRVVKLSDFEFSRDEEIFGIYDPMRSQWQYSEQWQVDSWFSADFSEPLIAGIYRLLVNLIDGQALKYDFDFRGTVELPLISSESFELQPDPFGNVIWKWEVPIALGHMVFNVPTAVKASIDIIQGDAQVAYFFIKIPSHMSYLFIPRNIVRQMSAKGEGFGLRIQLETGDNTTRSYSNTLIVDDLNAVVVRGKNEAE
jgi:hypothetical protein